MVSKQQLHADMVASMKARDELRTSTLRMTLSAITTEEVAGKVARELSDDDVQKVVAREAKKRRESAAAYTDAGRPELAERETAEAALLDAYLPAQLSDTELDQVVADALAGSDLQGPSAMGQAMRLVQPAVAGRAEGRRVADAVRRALAG